MALTATILSSFNFMKLTNVKFNMKLTKGTAQVKFHQVKMRLSMNSTQKEWLTSSVNRKNCWK